MTDTMDWLSVKRETKGTRLCVSGELYIYIRDRSPYTIVFLMKDKGRMTYHVPDPHGIARALAEDPWNRNRWAKAAEWLEWGHCPRGAEVVRAALFGGGDA